MKTVLPGSAIGLLGGGEKSRLFSQVAERLGYRVEILSSYDDLDRVREFAGRAEVVTVVSGDVPAIALQAAAASSALYPSVKTFAAVEDGIGAKRDPAKAVLADFAVIGARDANGQCVFYDPIAVDRTEGRLDIARMPAPIGGRIARKASLMSRDVLEDLDLTGVACLEFTLSQDSEIVLHDVTPGPHPCGYLTVDACVTSQFEQQLRAVCGLPLGSAKLMRPAAMASLANGDLNRVGAMAFPSVKLYCDHLTATAESATWAKEIVRAARASLISQ